MPPPQTVAAQRRLACIAPWANPPALVIPAKPDEALERPGILNIHRSEAGGAEAY